MATASKWEDVTLALGIERARVEYEPLPYRQETSFSLKASIPLPVWNQAQGRIISALAVRRRVALELDGLRARIANETETARQEIVAAGAGAALFDTELLPLARQIEEQLRSSYAAGQTSLPEVLRARGKRFELEAQRLDALRDLQLARARLASATGGGDFRASIPSRKNLR